MSSIITSLLKVTVGFLVDKARDRAVEKLRDGDVVDQKIREIIAREIEDVKSKLDALSRKDLLAAIDAFETGLRYLYKASDLKTDAATRSRQTANEAQLKEAVSLTTSPAPVDSIVLAAGMRNMELTEFVGEARRALSQGKERFKMAREEATRAFNNESLSTLDRITALRYRVMAAVLNSAAEEILGAASELSSLSMKSALKSALPEVRFGMEDQREIVSAVWKVNRAINDVLQATGENIDICYYPTIDIEVIAINADGEFILADDDKSVKVFHNNGKFIYKFYPHVRQTGYTGTELLAVATDENNNTYVLFRDLIGRNRLEVQVFNGAELGMKFHVLTEFFLTELTVGKGKLLVLTHDMVHVYYLNGRHERTFGSGIISNAIDVAVGPSGQIFVLDSHLKRCIVFNEDGVKKDESTVRLRGEKLLHGLAFHPLGEYFFVVGIDWWRLCIGTLAVEIYTTDGEFSREIILRENEPPFIPLPSFAISKEGRLAVTCSTEGIDAMVIVI
ncbi:uncharacterized protein [Montipora capricornis]|uniref:uncharacterized protein n=1 Tax=Montipora capricornis TaxID=246305 RepID=UPI0035F21AF9